MSMDPWEEGMRLKDIKLDSLQCWIQVHGLKLDKLSKKNAEIIDSNIEDIIQIDDVMGPKGLDKSYCASNW